MSVESSSRSATRTDRPSLAAYPIIGAIYLYRFTLSPLLAIFLGASCRFYPSCSLYAEEALRAHGAWLGSIMAVKRLTKCHPWHEGGFDPVSRTETTDAPNLADQV